MVSRRLMGTGALILRSDRDARGFVILKDDLDEALTGGIAKRAKSLVKARRYISPANGGTPIFLHFSAPALL